MSFDIVFEVLVVVTVFLLEKSAFFEYTIWYPDIFDTLEYFTFIFLVLGDVADLRVVFLGIILNVIFLVPV